VAVHKAAPYLTYTTSRNLIVDHWKVGLFHRLLQCVVLSYAMYLGFVSREWAYHEVPSGSVNAYHSTSDFSAEIEKSSFSEWPYCTSAFSSGASWNDTDYNYDNPTCTVRDAREVVEKGPNSLFIVTIIEEQHILGWPCASGSSASAAAKLATCQSAKGSPAVVMQTSLGQCSCNYSKAYYPVGVEAIGIAFEHSYFTQDRVVLQGSSMSKGDGGYLTTYFQHSNSTIERWESRDDATTGTTQTMTPKIQLRDILLKAGIASLDERSAAAPSPGGVGRLNPPYRTTGALLNVHMQYSNTHSGSETALPDVGAGSLPVVLNKRVHATVQVYKNHTGWGGWGAKASHVEFPQQDATGLSSYHTVIEYRQGIVLEFVATGIFFQFGWFPFFEVIVAAIVLLSSAATVTDLIAFNTIKYIPERLRLIPLGDSKLLRNKRNEKVSKTRSFAELGLKTAIAAKHFDALDVYRTGKVGYKDLVSIFGSLKDVDFEQASTIAQAVLADAAAAERETKAMDQVDKLLDLDISAATSARSEGDEDEGEIGLTFQRFMTVLEGSTMAFEEYIYHAGKASASTKALLSSYVSKELIEEAKVEYDVTAAETGISHLDRRSVSDEELEAKMQARDEVRRGSALGTDTSHRRSSTQKVKDNQVVPHGSCHSSDAEDGTTPLPAPAAAEENAMADAMEHAGEPVPEP